MDDDKMTDEALSTLKLLRAGAPSPEARKLALNAAMVAFDAAQPKAAVAIGRDGQDTRHRCSTENPNIEYRDCVNASTRDPNAKVRMG